MFNKYIAVLISIVTLWAGRLNHTATFSPSDLNFTADGGYDVVSLNGALATQEEGKPLLPLVNLNVLIPPSAEIKNVTVKSFDTYEIPGEYYIHPVQTPRPLSIKNPPPFVPPDPAVYETSKPYPEKIAEIVPSGSMSGYRIGGVLLYPVQYKPSEKKLILYTKIELEIEYEEGVYEVTPMTDRQLTVFGERAQEIVINPADVANFSPPEKQTYSFNTTDYVIITSSALSSAFTPLKNWLTKKGLNTEVVPVETIYVRYTGRDNPEKIRNFITDYWRNKGLIWVLIGGDDIVVPVRMGYCYYSPNNVATDLYYADLQWSWDGNRNNLFGEFDRNHSDRGDTVDLFYDVFVGRAPVDNATHVANFIRKDTIYEKRPPDTTYIRRILMPSEWLWSNIGYHGRICNRIITGYFPTTWRRSRIDDPTGNQIRDSLNVGYNFCHIVGHGSPNQVGVLTISLVPTLNNVNKLNIMNSIACECGWFDGQECMAETLINYPNGGCVADMLNSRYGWGAPPLMGPSEQLSVAFYRHFWQSGWEVGRCHALAKDELRNVAIGQFSARWSHYALNLFGDPALPMRRDIQRTATINYPSSITTGPQMVRVTVSYGGTPVKGALVCIMKGTETHGSGYTNSQGWIDLFVNATTTGSADITVTARDFWTFEGTITVNSGSPRPCLAFQSLYVDDGNNHRLDPGETANLIVTLKNAGNAVANNVRGTLRTTSPYITLIDSTSVYGNINGGDTARGDIYRVTASPSAKHGTEVEFIVNAVANEGTWQPFTKTKIGFPLWPASRLWANHDTAWLLLTVTALGSIGSTDWRGEGHGFIYPDTTSWTTSKLWLGSMACGTDPNYIVDRYFGVPCSIINKDFRVLDSLYPVIPPAWGHEEYIATYDDGYHPAAKNLQVTQRSLALYNAGYDDFVIIIYDYYNRGSNPINNLYSAVFCDFRATMWNELDTADYGYTDPTRRFAYVKYSLTTRSHAFGLRLLDPRTARNVSLMNLKLYTGMPDAVKDTFMTAKRTISSGLTPSNWGVVVSAGPYNLPAGGRWRCAYAIVGGHDTTQAKIHSDSAQSWYDRFVDIENSEQLEVITRHSQIVINSRIFTKSLKIKYDVRNNERVTINAFDVSGRLIDRVLDITGNASGVSTWQPKGLAGGIYFLRINDKMEKVIYIK